MGPEAEAEPDKKSTPGAKLFFFLLYSSGTHPDDQGDY